MMVRVGSVFGNWLRTFLDVGVGVDDYMMLTMNEVDRGLGGVLLIGRGA